MPSPSAASPAPNPVMLCSGVVTRASGSGEPRLALQVAHDALVLDLERCGALLEILDLRPHLFVELATDIHVLAQNRRDLQAQVAVLGEDLLDVTAVKQDVQDLIQQ